MLEYRFICSTTTKQYDQQNAGEFKPRTTPTTHQPKKTKPQPQEKTKPNNRLTSKFEVLHGDSMN